MGANGSSHHDSQVMGANGISHQVVADDLEGVRAVLTWLAFTPVTLGAPPPRLPSSDPSDRDVTVQPSDSAHLQTLGSFKPLGEATLIYNLDQHV